MSGDLRADRDPHRRFAEWLLAASDDEPPRDLAVHASVCADCQRQVAALDMLTRIDLPSAGMPPARAAGRERRIGVAGRVAVAVGGAAAVAAIGVSGWRVIEAGGIGLGAGDESPTQEVLGNTGQPEATIGPSQSLAEVSAQATPSASQSPSPTPGIVSSPVVLPGTPPPAQTAAPTSAATRTARPSSAPPSPTPEPTATVAPTPVPEATPTPAEESPTPVPEAA